MVGLYIGRPWLDSWTVQVTFVVIHHEILSSALTWFSYKYNITMAAKINDKELELYFFG
jgi:hypothetical protein